MKLKTKINWFLVDYKIKGHNSELITMLPDKVKI